MTLSTQQIIQALQYGELQAFGVSMPRLAPDWAAASNSFTVTDATPTSTSDPPIMTITSTAHWAAPLDAMFTEDSTIYTSIPDISGLIGQDSQGDEQCHHINEVKRTC